jgi:hypothetical protein
MKKFFYLLALSLICLGLAQGDVVDFGDSGIVVVVEEGGDDVGMETGWAYWFPDEFYDFFPPFPTLPTLPWPPAWGGGGGGDGIDDDCWDAQNDLLQKYEAISSYENSINEWESSGVMWVGDKKLTADDEEFQEILKNAKRVLDRLNDELNELRKAVQDAC